MNKRVLHLFSFLFLLSTTAFSQAVTMATATGGLSGAAQISGTNDIAILGVQLTKAAGGGNTVTTITVAMTPTPVGKFTNARLYESTDATFSGVGTETQIATGTISATDISFTGAPLSNFDGATAAADDEYFFIVVDVAPAASGSTTPSLASTGVIVSTGTTTGTTITGSTYTLTPPQTTIANLATGLAASPLQAGATAQGVFGFSLTSNGTQTLSTLNIQTGNTSVGKWSSFSLITSTDNSFATTGDNSAPIGGLTFNATATEIQITGLSQSITTSGTNFFLVADVNAAVNGSTTAVTPSLGSANATATTGTFTGTATGTAYSFAPLLTIANLTTGLASSPLTAGATNQGVFGFSLTSSGSQTVTVLNVQLSSTPASKWTNYRLITSTDASYATTGDNSAPIGGLTFTPSASQVAITGLSQVITSGTNYFLVVDVDPAVTGATAAIQPSLAAANVTITTGGGIATGTATGTSYSFGPLLTIANLSTGLAASPLTAGSTNQGVFGFSLTSGGSQTVTVINIQVSSTPASKWTNYRLITSTDASYATSGDNSAPIGGLTFTPSASQVAITGLSQVITSGTNYFLVVDVDPSVNGGTTAIQPSLGAANVTITSGGGGATGTATGTSYSFSPLLTIANLSTGLASSPLIAGTSNQGVFGFSLTSSGSQTVSVINIQLSSTPSSKWSNYRLITSTDASYATAGDNSAPIGGLTFTPSASQVAITGLSQVITSGTNYFLVVDVDPAVTGATTAVQPSLGAANVTVSTGGSAGTASGTSYSFTSATATFAQLSTGIASSPLFAGTTNQAVIGFSATSNGSQTFSAINIQTSSTPVSKWGSYSLVRSTDNSFTTTGDNTTIGGLTFTPSASQVVITGLTETLNGTTKNYFLVVTADPGVTSSTTAVQPSFTQANITAGTVAAVSVTGTSYSFNTSQNSDIILNGSVTTLIPYRTRQFSTIDNTDLAKSTRLATFQVRDGAGSDLDNKTTNLTSLTISVTHPEYIRQISLFDDDTDTEIAGTEQTGTNLSSITFTPSSPVSTAGDNGVRNLMVRATFMDVVNDNDQIAIEITGVTSNTSGSGFSPVGGWASTATAPGNNLIDVIATKLVFNPALPATVAINTNFTATVKAFDGLNNLDVDQTDQFALTESGPGTLTSFGGTTLTPFLVGGQFTWTDLRLSLAGSYPMLASDDAYDDDLGGDATGTITISSPASNISAGTTTPATICYGTAFFPLSNIVITETDPAGISGSGVSTFSIALPAGFVFDPSVSSGVVLSTGPSHDITAATGYTYLSSNTVVQFSFTVNGTANTNSITIGGLKVGRPHPGTNSPSPTGALTLTRSGGSATIAGVIDGTVLGNVSASQQNPAVDFTVDRALVTDPPIDPNTTTFNVSGAAVKLVSNAPVVPTGTSIFTGSGVTLAGSDYRFNPNSLSAGMYPITLTHTTTQVAHPLSGCQSVTTKSFEVIVSGITNLKASYCTNEAPLVGAMAVSPAYVTQIMGPGWSFSHFVYFDWNAGTWLPISNPSNTQFDPRLNEYFVSYQTFRSFGYPGLAVGFAVCDGVTYSCGTSTYVPTYQWVDLKTAPNVTFSLPTTFCRNSAPVTLIGSPPNSNNTTDDKFTASGGQGGSITNSLVPPVTGDQVWTFSPATVIGETPFTITYQYKDPVTGCSNTLDKQVTVFDVPTIVPVADIQKSIVSPGPSTTITLCQGAPLATFSATDAAYSYRWYADPVGAANIKSVLPTFNPPVDNLVAGVTPFYVTRVKNGCESLSTPLSLSVNVVATPAAPSPNFLDNIRQYCVGAAINGNHLGVPGTNVKWYTEFGITPIAGIANPNQPTPSELSISTSAANSYRYRVTQTEAVNSCESPATILNVLVQALPVITIQPLVDPVRICTTGGNVKFTPLESGGPAPGISWTINGAPSPGPGTLTNFNGLDGTVELNPLTGSPGTYTLRYTYANAAGCSNFGERDVLILPKVTPNVTVGNICDGLPAVVDNQSQVTPNTSTISKATWTFGDGQVVPYGADGTYATPIDPTLHPGITSGTYEDPQHIYPNVGTFQLAGKLTTSDGCEYDVPQIPLTVSPLPVVDFTITNVCQGTPTTFVASSTLPIQTYDWNFAKGGLLNSGTTSVSSNTTTFTYTQPGKDSVRLIATTAVGCQDIVDKPVFIVPNYTPISASNSYSQDFSVNDGWIAGGANSSWQLALPTGAPTPLTGNAWDTNPGGSSNPNENSWVLSGCFNFAASQKPVFSVDIWSDVPSGVDGAVLQYNISGNIEDNVVTIPPDPDGDWKVVGVVGSGINWYDENGISNSPGSQTTVSAGWTGKYGQWKRAIFKLDDILTDLAGNPNQPVVFRIAFASAQPRGEGFVFDNVFVGERSRIVLLENFTNSSINTSNHNDNNYRNFGNAAEIVKIQYHTAFPGDDPINDLNSQMNNSRAAFYGITEAPTVRIDGDFRNGAVGSWLTSAYDDRVLTPAAIKINVTSTKVGSEVKINTSVENTTTQSLPLAGAHIFTAIVEQSIVDATLLGNSGNSQFAYVAKDMLPTTAGISIPNDLAAGDIYNAPEITWTDRKDGDAIIVWVQSIDGSKNIYQAALITTQQPDLITGTEDPEYVKNIQVYPNPANQLVNIELPAAAAKPTPVVLIDAFGKTVYQSEFRMGEKTKAVSTETIANGVYMLQLTTPGGSKAVRKVMVKH